MYGLAIYKEAIQLIGKYAEIDEMNNIKPIAKWRRANYVTKMKKGQLMGWTQKNRECDIIGIGKYLASCVLK